MHLNYLTVQSLNYCGALAKSLTQWRIHHTLNFKQKIENLNKNAIKVLNTQCEECTPMPTSE